MENTWFELRDLLDHADFWKYVSIPFIAAIIGWGTNWLAIKMTFLPLEYVGFRPFLGWQGIVPSKVEKMGGILVDKTLTRLGSVSEIYHQIEPAKLEQYILKAVDPLVEPLVDEIMTSENAVLWENLPVLIRDQVYHRVRRKLPTIVSQFTADVGNNIENLVDIKSLVVSELKNDKALLNRLFLEVGSKEIPFIIKSGLYFGFIFGCVQALVWYFYQGVWVLPFFGVLVGFATNWLALNLIFRPLNPIKVGPFVIQGLFLKRQDAASEVFCKIFTHELLTVKQFVTALFKGAKSKRTKAFLRKSLTPMLEMNVLSRSATQLALGPGGYTDLKDTATDKIYELTDELFDDPSFNKERAKEVESMLKERMKELPPEDFQDLLRPIFQEDEWILIMLGSVLGGLAGWAQLVFVFGDNL